MNKNVLIVMTLLCTGQGYGSEQFGGRFTAEDALRARDCGASYSRIIEAGENKKTDGDATGGFLRIAAYIPTTTLATVGIACVAFQFAPVLPALGWVAGPAVIKGFIGNLAISEIIGCGAFAGFVRGAWNLPTDAENERILARAAKNEADTKNLTDASAQPSTDQEELQNAKLPRAQDGKSRKEIAFILSQKPTGWQGTDKEFVRQYFERLMLVSKSNATTSFSASSSSNTGSFEMAPRVN